MASASATEAGLRGDAAAQGVRALRVSGADDPRLSAYLDLREGALLREHGLFVAESRHVVRSLLRGGRFRVRSLFLTETALAELAGDLRSLRPQPRVFVGSLALLAEVAGYHIHQGCLALAERGPGLPPAAVMRAAVRGRGLILALERLANPVNLGSAFRNAQAFAADGVWLAPDGADPLYRKSVRVSLAATLQVPYARCSDWPADLAELRAAGIRVVACVADSSARDIADYADALPRRVPVALLFGSEEGLSRRARDLADDEVTISMAPGFDSLNVATATGIALHRFATRGARCAS